MLRAVAAVAVVTHHIPLFANGAWGVDLFFVISGFIMCHVTESSARHFLKKRIIRIVPLYWAGTIGVFAVALLAPHLVMNTSTDVADLARSLVFIPFQKGIAVEPVLFLGWSLNYEMFFYALFAVSMAASHRHRALVCSVLILTVVVSGRLIRFDSVALTFLTQPIMLEFIFGMLGYTVFWRAAWRTRHSSTSSGLPWAVTGAVLIAGMPLATVLAPGALAVIRHGIPAFLAFCLFVHGLSGVTIPRSLVLLGDSSYSLYLFHPYVVYTWDRVFLAFATHDVRAYFMACAAVTVCCWMSVVLFTYVEKPVTELLRMRFMGAQR